MESSPNLKIWMCDSGIAGERVSTGGGGRGISKGVELTLDIVGVNSMVSMAVRVGVKVRVEGFP